MKDAKRGLLVLLVCLLLVILHFFGLPMVMDSLWAVVITISCDSPNEMLRFCFICFCYLLEKVYFHYSGHGGLVSRDNMGGGFFQNAFKMGKQQQLQQQERRRLFGGGSSSDPTTKKWYDETLYPVDHERSGQIHDFSLFHHFVRPLQRGVIATCVLDCCHSGTVLDLPYQYQPTSLGSIRMQRSMDSLGNLAFLYLLAGHSMDSLGPGFDSLWHYVGQSLPEGTNVLDYQGTGMEELWTADQQDDTEFLASAAADGENNNDAFCCGYSMDNDNNNTEDNNNNNNNGATPPPASSLSEFGESDDNNTDDAVRGFGGPGGVDTNNTVLAGPGGEGPIMVVQGHPVNVDPAIEEYNQPPLIALGGEEDFDTGTTSNYHHHPPPMNEYYHAGYVDDMDDTAAVARGDGGGGGGGDYDYTGSTMADYYYDSTRGSVGSATGGDDGGSGSGGLDCCLGDDALAGCSDVLGTFMEAAAAAAANDDGDD